MLHLSFEFYRFANLVGKKGGVSIQSHYRDIVLPEILPYKKHAAMQSLVLFHQSKQKP